MEKRTVLFYDHNSADAHLSRLICGVLYDFVLVAVGTATDFSYADFQFHSPASQYENEEVFGTFIFVGTKPTLEFCQKVSDSKIIIINDGSVSDEFYLSKPNAVIVEKYTYKTLTATLTDYLKRAYTIQTTKQKMLNAGILNDLIFTYEKYAKSYKNPETQFANLSAYNYVNNLKDISEINFGLFCDILYNEGSMVNYHTGRLEYIKNDELMTKVISNAVLKEIRDVDGLLVCRTIAIDADEKLIHKIDNQLREFMVANVSTFGMFDYIEYYKINSNKSVTVRAKHYASFISPTEIKNMAELIEFIGYEKYTDINNFLIKAYTPRPEVLIPLVITGDGGENPENPIGDSIIVGDENPIIIEPTPITIKYNFDGTISITTDLETFFQL